MNNNNIWMNNAEETIYSAEGVSKELPILCETLRQKDRIVTELWRAKHRRSNPTLGESLRLETE